MSTEPTFKYDIAFSFLTKDQALAESLNDTLKDEVSTFIYTEHKEKIIGKDGVEVFPTVFRTDARVVVIIFSKGWGVERMTGVEAAAVKSRVFEQPLSQFLFVIVVDGTRPPDWIPAHFIYHDIKRDGEEILPALLRMKVIENKGMVKQATALDRAAKLSKERQNQIECSEFLRSMPGVKVFGEQFGEVLHELESIATRLEAHPTLHCRFKNNNNVTEFYCAGYSVNFHFEDRYSNDVSSVLLIIEIYDGSPPGPGRMFIDKPKKVGTERFNFICKKLGSYGWKERHGNNFLNSAQLAEYILDLLLTKGKTKSPP